MLPALAPIVANGAASPAGGPAAPESVPMVDHLVKIAPETSVTGIPGSAALFSNICVPPAVASAMGKPSEPATPPNC